MLTNRHYVFDEDVDFIHNFYERLVAQEIFDQSTRAQEGDRDFLADVACVALNRMPPRYIRHDVDMTFFMSPQDIQEIERKVSEAVTQAINYVEGRERGENIKLPPLEVSLIANRASKPNQEPLEINDSAPTKTAKAPKATAKPKSSKKKDS
jgi:hypothetical protein